jgi:hypothetical protein
MYCGIVSNVSEEEEYPCTKLQGVTSFKTGLNIYEFCIVKYNNSV